MTYPISSDKLALLFFVLLFPLFFAYHTLIATEIISPILPGGGWSVVNALGAVVLGYFLVRELPRTQGARYVLASVSVLGAWTAAYGLYYFRFGNEMQRNPVLLLETGKLLLGWACLFCIGYLIRPSRQYARPLIWTLAAMCAISVLVLDPVELRRDVPGGASHQWFGQAVAVTGIAALALLNHRRLQIVAVLITLAALVHIWSRADLIGFGLVATTWLVRRGALFRYRAAIGAVAVLLLFTPSSPKADDVPDPLDTSSLAARNLFLERGIQDIRRSPILGDYGAQMRGPGWDPGLGWVGRFGLGAYIHNVLSVWQQFGLIPFLLYSGLSVAAAAIPAWIIFGRPTDDPAWTLTLYVGSFALLLVIIAKSVFWPLPALAWGLLAGQLNRHGLYPIK